MHCLEQKNKLLVLSTDAFKSEINSLKTQFAELSKKATVESLSTQLSEYNGDKRKFFEFLETLNMKISKLYDNVTFLEKESIESRKVPLFRILS